MKQMFRRLIIGCAALFTAATGAAAQTPTDPCAVASLQRSAVQGLRVDAADGKSFLVERKDAHGVSQVYVGEGEAEPTCITCTQQRGGPKPERFKMQPHWHPSGRWIFLAVERDRYTPPPMLGWNRKYVEGQLQNGLWTDLWVVSPDGLQWHRLTAFASGVKGVADGFSGPAVSPDGRTLVWSQIVDGNVFAYWPFGRWQLMRAGFDDDGGATPRLVDPRDITPVDMAWNEPGNFHPDGAHVLVSGSTAKDAQGMDQFIIDVQTGELQNLTRSPTVWDEHGVFSPDGTKIVFMSAEPYRDDPKASKILTIKTEFMLMNRDNGGAVRLTHFAEPGYPEHSPQRGIAANAEWSADGRTLHLLELFFPDYEYWDLVFAGACGDGRRR